MSDKIAISRETLTVLADEHCPYGLLMAAKAIARDLLAKPALISALHENGELIALQATVAQQAKMIEHLRGEPTPLYTAVDMANAARNERRGIAESLIERLAIAYPDSDAMMTAECFADWLSKEMNG